MLSCDSDMAVQLVDKVCMNIEVECGDFLTAITGATLSRVGLHL